jgi:arginase family enzyme
VGQADYHLAPGAIRERLSRLSTFDANHRIDIVSLPVVDLGDALIPPPLSAGLTVLLGGHNAVTWLALSRVDDLQRWGLLTIDAHHDVRSYAPGHVSNGSPVRALIDSGLPGNHVIQVGIQGFSNSAEHRRWCEAQGVRVLESTHVHEIEALLDGLSTHCDQIYVDLDLDVLDRAFAPACPGSRPGGLMPQAVFNAAYAAGKHHAVRAIDIVELDPTNDVASVTTDCAALCLLNIASGYAMRSLGSPQFR